MGSDFTPLFNSGLSLLKNQIKMGKSLIPDIGKGDIISGKIIEMLSQTKYLIRVRGNDIIAESDLNLNVGDIYKMEVLKADSRLTVKVLPFTHDPKDFQAKVMSILKDYDLPVNSVNKNAVERLLSLGIQMDRENITSFMQLLNEYRKNDRSDKITAKDLTTLIFADKNNISTDKNSLKALRDIITGREHIFNTCLGEDTLEMLYKLSMSDSRLEENDELKKDILKLFINNADSEFDNLILSGKISDITGNIYSSLAAVLCSEHRSLLDKTVLIGLIRIFSLFQQINIVNSGEFQNEKIFYSPLLIRNEDGIRVIELFYRKLTLYPENMDPVPGFEINILFLMGDPAPVHVNITKKVPGMLNISINHPGHYLLKSIKKHKSGLRKRVNALGYRSVKINYEQNDTASEEYRTNLFFPKTQILKSIDFTG
ncbi:MAG: hypothetical protein GY863_03740 [bacterium]|nr:hypothetical protein [bacterium]